RDQGGRGGGSTPRARHRLLGLRLRPCRRAQAPPRLALRERDLPREHPGLAPLPVRRHPAREPGVPGAARSRARRRVARALARRSRHSVLRPRAPWALGLALWLLGAAPPAPLEVEGPGGESVALAPRDGRALVVHFWATWCPSCVEEVPELLRAAAGCAGAVD